MLQPVADAGDGARVLALLLEQAHQRGHGVLAPPHEALPRRSDPVVVAAGKQRALAEVHRPLQAAPPPLAGLRPARPPRPRRSHRSKESDVEAERGIRGPTARCWRRSGGSGRPGAAPAGAGGGAAAGCCGRSTPRRPARRQRRAAPATAVRRMQEEVGEERLQPRGREASGGLAVHGQAELPEEMDLERCCHRRRGNVAGATVGVWNRVNVPTRPWPGVFRSVGGSLDRSQAVENTRVEPWKRELPGSRAASTRSTS